LDPVNLFVCVEGGQPCDPVHLRRGEEQQGGETLLQGVPLQAGQEAKFFLFTILKKSEPITRVKVRCMQA
jgi:hypothetical protein